LNFEFPAGHRPNKKELKYNLLEFQIL
jgi:hypothetical protein